MEFKVNFCSEALIQLEAGNHCCVTKLYKYIDKGNIY